MNLPSWIYLANIAQATKFQLEHNSQLKESELPTSLIMFLAESKIDKLKAWEKEQLQKSVGMPLEELQDLITNIYSGWVRAKLQEMYDLRQSNELKKKLTTPDTVLPSPYNE